MRTLERKNKELKNNKDSILFNQTCSNEKMVPKYTFFIYIYIYIYIYMKKVYLSTIFN